MKIIYNTGSARHALRQLMDERGMSAYRLAHDAGVSQAMISRYLNGHTDMTMGTYMLLLRALGAAMAVRPLAAAQK